MADIELVIKIPEEDFEIMKHNIEVDNPLCPLSQEKMVTMVANGKPLPREHGRLIDADYEIGAIKIAREKGYKFNYDTLIDFVNVLPTIIEADRGE